MRDFQMATLGEYSSLLQLGVGFGIGLSLFRAPMTLYLDKLENDLAAEVDVLEKVNSPKAREARSVLATLKLEISKKQNTLERWNLPFLIAAILGAAVNWMLLITASMCATYTLSFTQQLWLLVVSVGLFIAVGASASAAAYIVLNPVKKALLTIRGG
jgi:hypothetical protein